MLGLAGNCSLVLTQPPELIASTVWSVVSSHGQGKGIWESLQEYRKASRQKKVYIYSYLMDKTSHVALSSFKGEKKYNSITCMDRGEPESRWMSLPAAAGVLMLL